MPEFIEAARLNFLQFISPGGGGRYIAVQLLLITTAQAALSPLRWQDQFSNLYIIRPIYSSLCKYLSLGNFPDNVYLPLK